MSFEKQVAMALLGQNVLDKCVQVGVRRVPPKFVAESCLLSRYKINNYFDWSRASKVLNDLGFPILPQDFSDYYHGIHMGEVNLKLVFEMMLRPPVVKPLSDWN